MAVNARHNSLLLLRYSKIMYYRLYDVFSVISSPKLTAFMNIYSNLISIRIRGGKETHSEIYYSLQTVITLFSDMVIIRCVCVCVGGWGGGVMHV